MNLDPDQGRGADSRYDGECDDDKRRMKRAIVGFDKDEIGDWRAILSCGHRQHVRHNPPLVSRPWVLSEAGRRGFLGAMLTCKLCDEVNGNGDYVEHDVNG